MMSERRPIPSEEIIINILERYANKREEVLYQKSGVVHTDRETDEEREDTEKQQEWSNSRETLVSELLEELQHNIARNGDLFQANNRTGAGNHDGSKYEQRATDLEEKLYVEELKSKSLQLQLEETNQAYRQQLCAMNQKIQYLENQLASSHRSNKDDRNSPEQPQPQPQQQQHDEEASQMEMTQFMDETSSTTLVVAGGGNGIKSNTDINETTTTITTSIMKEMQKKVSVLTVALTDMEIENEQLKEELLRMSEVSLSNNNNHRLSMVMLHHDDGRSYFDDNNDNRNEMALRIDQLEKSLASTQKAFDNERRRRRALDGVIAKAEDVVVTQRKKLETANRSQKKTRELYEYERSARLGLEHINDRLKAVVERLHTKLDERTRKIESLNEELDRRDEMVQGIQSMFEEASAGLLS
jgi:hypothetical protein